MTPLPESRCKTCLNIPIQAELFCVACKEPVPVGESTCPRCGGTKITASLTEEPAKDDRPSQE